MLEAMQAAKPSAATELLVSGMTCNNCARHVSEALRTVPGVTSAVVRLEDNSATVQWGRGASPSTDMLVLALKDAGYDGAEKPAAAASRRPIFAGWEFNVFFGGAVTLPLILLEWFAGAGLEAWYKWLSFALVLPLQVFGGSKFYRGAWTQLKAGRSNMDTLVSLGSTTAFLYSVWGLLAGWQTHLYFMDAAAILTLVSLGHYLEQKASAQAASSLKALLGLAPQTARRIAANGVEENVAVADLRPGDVVLLKPGDRVPIDGEVTEGQSSVDESMLTGESMPVEKGPGEKMFAGTINESGAIQLRAKGTGEETALAQIIQIVQRAQSSRANIQRLGDRVSSVFVPVVILIALGAAIWWGFFPTSASAVHAWFARFLWHAHTPEPGLGAAVFYAAAVLIIACPCAMGLATPVAIMAGANAAARRGILIRDGAALEKSGQITAILFDKTGTLTEGKLSVAEAKELVETGSIELAGALAAGSTHPVSRAIAVHAGSLSRKGNGLSELDSPRNFEGWREVRGAGIEAAGENGKLRLGRLDWLAENGAASSDDFTARWEQEGATVVGLALDSRLLALFALKDAPKARARETVQKLAGEGYEIWLVTGDNAMTAKVIAEQVGIPQAHVLAKVRPEEKLAAVERIRGQGHRVAFVGDGINDAPALQGADLGIALMNASDVAREQADIVLLKADLEGVAQALGLARATLRTIKQNLFWAFFYNALGVPLAALGFLSPMFSAFAMGASDLIVVGNALRLKRGAPISRR